MTDKLWDTPGDPLASRRKGGVGEYRTKWCPTNDASILKLFLSEREDLTAAERAQVVHADHTWRWDAGVPLDFSIYVELHENCGLPPNELLRLLLREFQFRVQQADEFPRDLLSVAARFAPLQSEEQETDRSVCEGKMDALAPVLKEDALDTLLLEDEQHTDDNRREFPDEAAAAFAKTVSYKVLQELPVSDVSESRSGSDIGQPLPPLLGEYELLEKIKAGGMGVVYKAKQLSLNRVVALKLILNGRFADDEQKLRFRNEAEAAAKLTHSNIVPVYEINEVDECLFFTMELVEGQSWSHMLRSELPSTQRAAEWIQLVAEAIEYAHQQGILHRDIKPSNVLIDSHGQPRITDFGLARAMVGPSDLTLAGQIIGTPNYMPPEQAAAEHDRVGPASDVYSIGATLYELLTGRPPFRANTPHLTLAQVIDIDPVSPRKMNPGVPIDLDTICMKCLEKSPGNRYLSAAALAADLRRYLCHEPIHARPVGYTERLSKFVRRRPALVTTAASVVVLCIVVIGGIIWQWRDATESAARLQRQLYVNRIALAEREWSANRAQQADQILDQCPSEMRHWEWKYLKRLCHPEAENYRGHNGTVSCVTLSSDGQHFASAGADRTIRVWDVLSGKTVAIGRGHNSTITCLAFNRDGHQLASAGTDNAVRLWDAQSMRLIRTFGGHTDIVRGVCFNAVGTLLASTGADATVRIWDVPQGQCKINLPCQFGTGHSVSFNDDGSLLAVAEGVSTGGGKVTVWNIETGQLAMTLEASQSWLTAVAFSPDGLHLSSADSKGSVQVWRVSDWRKSQEFHVHDDPITSLQFSPDSERIISASGEPRLPGQIVAWNILTEQVEYRLHGSTGPASVGPRGRRVAAPIRDEIRTWNIDSMGHNRIRHTKGEWLQAVAVRSDSQYVAHVGESGRVWLTGLTNLDSQQISHDKKGKLCVTFSPNRRFLAWGGKDGRVTIWDLATHRVHYRLSINSGWIRAIDFSPDGELLATAGDDKIISVWDTGSWQLQMKLRGHGAAVTGLNFSPSARLLVSCSHDQTLRLWDLSDRRTRYSRRYATAWLNAVTFAPDGQSFATATEDGLAIIWNTTTGVQSKALGPHGSSVSSVAYHPDGSRLATGSFDGTVKIWDPDAGVEILTLREHPGGVSDVQFSPDGSVLISSGYDGNVRLWRSVRSLTAGPSLSDDSP